MKKLICSILTIAIVFSCVALIATPVNAATVSSDALFPFVDVSEGAWYREGIEFCYANSAINGMTAYSFQPNATLTRAQFIVMLANAVDADLSEYTTSSFDDVKPGTWFASAVEWGYRNGYVEGAGNNKFLPSNLINREQICCFFMRYIKKNHPEIKPVEFSVMFNAFYIGDLSYWAREGVMYCYAADIIAGIMDYNITPPTLALRPKDSVTRAQAARMMSQFLKNVYYGGCQHVYSQPTCTEAATCECGIKIGLPLGHKCSVLNCQSGSRCFRCGEYVPFDKNLHDLDDGNCLEGPKCKDCGTVYGLPLGHTTSHGECSRCGTGIFPTNHARICYYVQKKGVEVGSYYKHTTNVTTDNGKKMTVELFYKPAEPAYGPFTQGEGSLIVRSKYYLNEANWVETRIGLRREQSTGEKYHSYTVMYYTYEFADAYVSGELRADNMTKDRVQMSFRSGSSSLEAKEPVYYTVKYFDYALRNLCGSDANEYHFYHIDG